MIIGRWIRRTLLSLSGIALAVTVGAVAITSAIPKKNDPPETKETMTSSLITELERSIGKEVKSNDG